MNPSLLFFCVRQGRTSCRESFFSIIIAKFPEAKNNKAGKNIRFHDIVQKNLFLRRLMKKLNKKHKKRINMDGLKNRGVGILTLYPWIMLLYLFCFVNGLACIE